MFYEGEEARDSVKPGIIVGYCLRVIFVSELVDPWKIVEEEKVVAWKKIQ